MRRWWLVIALLLSLGINLGIVVAVGARIAANKPRPEPRPERPEPNNPQNPPVDPVQRIARLADHLKLEGETRRKFVDIQWNLFQETTRQRLQLAEVHRDLRRELTRPAPDRQKIEGLLNESSQLYLALERSLVNNVYATRELLSPDKEKEYLKMIGRLRVPNPGPGIANPGGQPPRRPLLERLRERRQERFGEGPPPRFRGEGPPRDGDPGPPPEGEEGPPPGEEEASPPPPPSPAG